MTMAAFPHFDPYLVLAEGEERDDATLDGLAEASRKSEKQANQTVIGDARENPNGTTNPAKAAKSAKATKDEGQTLAALATLAAPLAEIEDREAGSSLHADQRCDTPTAAADHRNRENIPANVAEAANPNGAESLTLATLGALAAGRLETANRPSNSALDLSAVGAAPAKAAKLADRFPPAIWAEAEQEQAAIVDHDRKTPRPWSEGFARLDPDRPPADVPPQRWERQRWQCFVNDVGLFLDSEFCAAAATLGWGPFNLFGCDRDRPFTRIDQAGLLWLLNSNRLLAISEDTAVIETGTGARQVFRRKPNGAGRVLAWELRF